MNFLQKLKKRPLGSIILILLYFGFAFAGFICIIIGVYMGIVRLSIASFLTGIVYGLIALIISVFMAILHRWFYSEPEQD